MSHQACPFCGQAIDDHCCEFDWEQGAKWGAVVCPSCGAKGPEVRTGYRPIVEWADAAYHAWDRRLPEGG